MARPITKFFQMNFEDWEILACILKSGIDWNNDQQTASDEENCRPEEVYLNLGLIWEFIRTKAL